MSKKHPISQYTLIHAERNAINSNRKNLDIIIKEGVVTVTQWTIQATFRNPKDNSSVPLPTKTTLRPHSGIPDRTKQDYDGLTHSYTDLYGHITRTSTKHF